MSDARYGTQEVQAEAHAGERTSAPDMSRATNAHLDVAVIGAGQAGLALGYYLAEAGVNFRLLEAADKVGASWARRWDSLRLFTPAQYNSLPGFAFPGDPWKHPGKDEVADYLAMYAKRHALPVHLDTRVTRLNGAAGDFRLHLASREPLRARSVAIATGAFGSPFVPALANRLDPQVLQIHSEDYRNPGQLRGEDVAVIGGGNSGFQIALELANHGKRVSLSEGVRLRNLPQRLLGRDLFWWLTTTGLIGAAGSSPLGRRLRANEPIIGTSRRNLRRAAVSFRPRTVEASGDRLTFGDGTNIKVDTVVWATGYRHDDTWIDIPGALNEHGVLANQDGVTPVEGLYTLGRPWQRDRGSSLLGYVRRDAETLALRLVRQISQQ